ncbi:hypothetical protein [Lysobacter capsici]|uniref:hypothetical protein n=1 Tax=Lysobacter capsici TaxID=435897 RepID=UPI001C0012F2|nr:hypothetical protein [Lysobacter capsici]QWF18440.1 hypothetical protein KME82_06700 [Lysobacter capsici]
MFEKFDEYISKDWGIDYWSDVGVDDAARILICFDDEDWSALAGNLPSRPFYWLKRCAEVLGQLPCDKSLSGLVHIALMDDHEAAVAALDSLRDFEAEGVSLAGHKNILIERIDALIPHADPIELIVLHIFRKDLFA